METDKVMMIAMIVLLLVNIGLGVALLMKKNNSSEAYAPLLSGTRFKIEDKDYICRKSGLMDQDRGTDFCDNRYDDADYLRGTVRNNDYAGCCKSVNIGKVPWRTPAPDVMYLNPTL